MIQGKNMRNFLILGEVSSLDVPMPPSHRDDDDHSPLSYEPRIDNQKSHQNDISEIQAIINERNRLLNLSRGLKY